MISSKITPAKKKESARRKKGGEEKTAMVSLLAFLLALILENCLTEKVYLAVTFSKLRIDIYMHPSLPCRKLFFKGNKPKAMSCAFERPNKNENYPFTYWNRLHLCMVSFTCGRKLKVNTEVCMS